MQTCTVPLHTSQVNLKEPSYSWQIPTHTHTHTHRTHTHMHLEVRQSCVQWAAVLWLPWSLWLDWFPCYCNRTGQHCEPVLFQKTCPPNPLCLFPARSLLLPLSRKSLHFVFSFSLSLSLKIVIHFVANVWLGGKTRAGQLQMGDVYACSNVCVLLYCHTNRRVEHISDVVSHFVWQHTFGSLKYSSTLVMCCTCTHTQARKSVRFLKIALRGRTLLPLHTPHGQLSPGMREEGRERDGPGEREKDGEG